MIDLTELFGFLKVSNNYTIDNVDINKQTHELYIKLKSNESEVLVCPSCSKRAKKYDALSKSWRHKDFSSYKVYIVYETPRVKCSNHGVKLTSVQWAHPRHAFTKEMEYFMLELSKSMNYKDLGKVLGEHDTRVRRVIRKVAKDEK